MKKLILVPLLLVAIAARADEVAFNFGLDRAQSLTGGTDVTKASVSYGYLWNDAVSVQADAGLSRFSTGTDVSLGVQSSYALTPEIRVGVFGGWQKLAFDPADYIYHGVEFEYAIEAGSIAVYTSRNGNDGFPATDFTSYGAEIRMPANDNLTLVGRGIMRDQDATDVFTTIVGAGVEYIMPNGVTLNGELVKWDRKQAWVPYDDGITLSIGAQFDLDRKGFLFSARDSVTETFGSNFRFP